MWGRYYYGAKVAYWVPLGLVLFWTLLAVAS